METADTVCVVLLDWESSGVLLSRTRKGAWELAWNEVRSTETEEDAVARAMERNIGHLSAVQGVVGPMHGDSMKPETTIRGYECTLLGNLLQPRSGRYIEHTFVTKEDIGAHKMKSRFMRRIAWDALSILERCRRRTKKMIPSEIVEHGVVPTTDGRFLIDKRYAWPRLHPPEAQA